MNKDQLRPGDQIIAIKDARFPKHISKEEHYSQRVGDIIMVNNPRIGDSVGGTGITGYAYNGRPKIGICSSFQDGTYRRATPSDHGYLGTRDTWPTIKDDDIKRLKSALWGRTVDLWVTAGIAIVLGIGLELVK